MRDLRWMSSGGLLIDGSGDIACTDSNSLESTHSVVRSRLKAALNGFKLYKIGADLQNRIGDTVSQETEIGIRRQITQCLSTNFLSTGSFQVETISDIDKVHAFVYMNKELVGKVTVTRGS